MFHTFTQSKYDLIKIIYTYDNQNKVNNNIYNNNNHSHVDSINILNTN